MAEVVLFHHVQGLTEGVRRLADALRSGGHTVHTPDLFDGATFGSLDDGELFVYPGDVHLFTDSSLPSHDAAASALVVERALAFLARV